MDGFVIGISGGVDSAVTSTLCALTGRPTLVVSMPIRQPEKELTRANNHIADLSSRFENVESITVDLTPVSYTHPSPRDQRGSRMPSSA